VARTYKRDKLGRFASTGRNSPAAKGRQREAAGRAQSQAKWSTNVTKIGGGLPAGKSYGSTLRKQRAATSSDRKVSRIKQQIASSKAKVAKISANQRELRSLQTELKGIKSTRAKAAADVKASTNKLAELKRIGEARSKGANTSQVQAMIAAYESKYGAAKPKRRRRS